MNKKGQAFTDLFLFMIVAVIILFISAIFIYLGLTVKDQFQASVTGLGISDNVNYTQISEDTLGDLNTAYATLYWLSVLLIVGMMVSIFVGNYLVTTRPIYFVAYIFIVIIAVIVSVGISNAYQMVAESDTPLKEIMANFIGGNYIMYYLPLWITVIGFVGGIIMFVRMKSQEVMASPYG